MRRAGLCDPEACVAPLGLQRIAVTNRRETLDDDCARANLVIALYPVSQRERAGCASALIDRRDIWNEGAHAATIYGSGAVRIESVKDRRGERPWSGD
jgi:competence protein ComEC